MGAAAACAPRLLSLSGGPRLGQKNKRIPNAPTCWVQALRLTASFFWGLCGASEPSIVGSYAARRRLQRVFHLIYTFFAFDFLLVLHFGRERIQTSVFFWSYFGPSSRTKKEGI